MHPGSGIPVTSMRITNATDRIQNPPLQTGHNRSSHGYAKQHILLVQWSGFPPKKGLPMGCSISGILAILYMDRLETIALSSHLSISRYRRYVDDIYLQTTGEKMPDQFHHSMNNLHPKLKFEIEKPEITPNGLSLSLLDFKVTISKDGKSSLEFYQKQQRNHYSFTTNQLYPRKQRSTSFAMSGNASKINALQKRQAQSTKTCLTTSSVLMVIQRTL